MHIHTHTVVLGTDFNATPIETREKLVFYSHNKEKFLKSIVSPETKITEAVVLSTCNRTEFYFVTQDTDYSTNSLLNAISSYCGIEYSLLAKIFYKYTCEAAADHLFRVTSGLESMVIGENEILGQVKEAYQISVCAGCSGAFLKKLFEKSFSVGKNIRTKTDIGKGAYSVFSVSYDLIQKHTVNLPAKKILIIGLSKMGFGLLNRIKKDNNTIVTIANRTIKKSEHFSKYYNCNYIRYEQIYDHLDEYDIVVAATASPSHIINYDNLYGRHFKTPVTFIDMGVPRNIDPEIDGIAKITLFNIDDLKKISEDTLKKRTSEIDKVVEIINKSVGSYTKWHKEKVLI